MQIADAAKTPQARRPKLIYIDFDFEELQVVIIVGRFFQKVSDLRARNLLRA